MTCSRDRWGSFSSLSKSAFCIASVCQASNALFKVVWYWQCICVCPLSVYIMCQENILVTVIGDCYVGKTCEMRNEKERAFSGPVSHVSHCCCQLVDKTLRPSSYAAYLLSFCILLVVPYSVMSSSYENCDRMILQVMWHLLTCCREVGVSLIPVIMVPHTPLAWSFY